MKTKISLGIIALAMIAGAFVFANDTKKADNNCQDRPGCVCVDETTCKDQSQTTTGTDACSDKPGCVCTE